MVNIRVHQLGSGAISESSTAPRLSWHQEQKGQEEALLAEARLWEDDPECGFMCTLFDSARGNRRMFACNRRAAEMVGMHKEELLARYARRDVDVPFVQADWLANFVHDLDYADEARNERFLRMALWLGGVRRPALVHSTKVKVFDSAGRVSRVAPARPRHCTKARLAPAILSELLLSTVTQRPVFTYPLQLPRFHLSLCFDMMGYPARLRAIVEARHSNRWRLCSQLISEARVKRFQHSTFFLFLRLHFLSFLALSPGRCVSTMVVECDGLGLGAFARAGVVLLPSDRARGVRRRGPALAVVVPARRHGRPPLRPAGRQLHVSICCVWNPDTAASASVSRGRPPLRPAGRMCFTLALTRLEDRPRRGILYCCIFRVKLVKCSRTAAVKCSRSVLKNGQSWWKTGQIYITLAT